MKTKILPIVLLGGICSFLWPNPIDDTPITKFSELVFDAGNNWTMEIFFPFGYRTEATDSIILKVANTKAKLKTTYHDGTRIGILTPDSLSIPLTINREGDSLMLLTYSNRFGNRVRVDGLIFGEVPGAGVGQPVSGYSIMRNSLQEHYNDLTVDCLTLNSSLGAINDTLGLSATLQGHIYDLDNNPVTKLKEISLTPSYFTLHTALHLSGNGTYSTKVFRKFITEAVDQLFVRLMGFEGWRDTVAVAPFELNNIFPHTTVVQDIHLKSNEYVVTGVENLKPPETSAIELINYPNPFNASTNFFVKIPESLQKKSGHISIYNASGQFVKKIPLKSYATGNWDGTDEHGDTAPTGIYYYRLALDEQILKSGSMILLK
ncbi:MAG: hypothetical protein ALAOOOJD_01242 [bacterium]|nr:hypothetical protein [bacterium]